MWRGDPVNTLYRQAGWLAWAGDTGRARRAGVVHRRAPPALPGQQGRPRDLPGHRPHRVRHAWPHRHLGIISAKI